MKSDLKRAKEYFAEFVTTKEFQDGVKELRKNYGIPKNGFPGFNEKTYISEGAFYTLPPLWRANPHKFRFQEFDNDYYKLWRPFLIDDYIWRLGFYAYIFYGKFLNFDYLTQLYPAHGFLNLVDARRFVDRYADDPSRFYRNFKDLSEKFPYYIEFVPGVTKTQFKKFIDEIFDSIPDSEKKRTLQSNNSKKVKINRKRDMYVFSQRGKFTYAEIAVKTAKKFHLTKFNEDNVRVIISRMKKKLQGVK